MTLTDKNKIFFALIHYILVEQKNVDWILKTSLIDFTGISSLLEERPYKTDSILDDVVDYITNIKPYHVQFSHYFEHYQTHSENVTIHVNDWIEPVVHMRFDALKSIPDINRIFDKYVLTLASASGEKYNVENMIIYAKDEKRFFIRRRDGLSEYYWEMIDEPIYDDGFYYSTSDKKYYKGNIGNLVEFTSSDTQELIDSHRANRLFYMGLHDNDEIKKELNANFKGIQIEGGTFDIGKFGYDIFNYDTNEYDSPTIIYDYYFLNKLKTDLQVLNPDGTVAKTIMGAKTELEQYFNLGVAFVNQPEFKEFVNSSDERFYIPDFIYRAQEIGNKVFVYTVNSGTIKKYVNFEVFNGYIDIFKTLKNKEKVYVVTTNSSATDPLVDGSEVTSAYIIECSTYSVSNDISIRRQIVEIVNELDGNNNPVTDYKLQTPISIGGSNDKIAVQKVAKNGSRTPILNPIINDGMLQVSLLNINEYEHVSMVSFDFKYLYDKIYTWEDKYGRSNNVVYLNGEKFYRARYEEDRPSEAVFSSPITSLFVYNDDENNRNILFNDFKNKQSSTKFLSDSYSTITNIETTVFTEVTPTKTVSYDLIDSITFDNVDNFEKAPGKVIINSEIIQYNNINKTTKTISQLKRSCDGTFFYINGVKNDEASLTHKIGDVAYPMRSDEWLDIKRNNVYKGYNVKSKDSNVYDCPTGIKKTSTVKVKKLSTIKLLEDVKLSSRIIRISSPNVVPKQYIKDIMNGEIVTGDFYLKINSDTVRFNTIYIDPDSNGYCIEDFTFPEEYIGYGSRTIYYADDSTISSCITEYITDFSVEMIEGDWVYDVVIENDETYLLNDIGDKLFRIVGSTIDTYVDEKGITRQKVTKLGNIVNIYNSSLNDITNEYYQSESYFGFIGNDNILYKDDGIIYGKVEKDGDDYKIMQVMTQITIHEELNKNDNIYINIHNFKYSSTNNDNW